MTIVVPQPDHFHDEIGRRARLHRQIGALETQLKGITGLDVPANRERYARLRNKITKLTRELLQPRLPNVG